MYLGCHVSMSGANYLLGSVEEALSYNANTFMFYTGAPQNTARKDIKELKVEEAKALMKEHGLDMKKVVVHAHYIINLANTLKPETFQLATSFLEKEIERVSQIGAQYLVLHPGSHVKAGEQVGLEQIVKGLNMVLKGDSQVYICLETMAGKGSELGANFNQIKYIIDHVQHNHLLKVCLDTCHIHDAGYDIVNDLDGVLQEFDTIIGLDRLAVIHINDSKNEREAHKDRHENIGHGHIGFPTLAAIVNHPLLEDKIKILETPWYESKAPYQKEIAMLLQQEYQEDYLDSL
ncbi:MAG: deoxyribonuclease IV [Bacilli bacterium]